MNGSIDFANIVVTTAQGGLRIANTRVSLDSVVYAFCDGATPEEICQDFSALSLVQVYSAIAYYLTNREQVDRYLQATEASKDDLRQELDNRHKEFLRDLRQRLNSGRPAATLP